MRRPIPGVLGTLDSLFLGGGMHGRPAGGVSEPMSGHIGPRGILDPRIAPAGGSSVKPPTTHKGGSQDEKPRK